MGLVSPNGSVAYRVPDFTFTVRYTRFVAGSAQGLLALTPTRPDFPKPFMNFWWKCSSVNWFTSRLHYPLQNVSWAGRKEKASVT
jgi:hypothetical protein